jgi:hypothetical protein
MQHKRISVQGATVCTQLATVWNFVAAIFIGTTGVNLYEEAQFCKAVLWILLLLRFFASFDVKLTYAPSLLCFYQPTKI